VNPDAQLVRGTTTILILSTLAAEPMHGYRLVRALEERCHGALSFKEGTIYPLLYALEDRGHLRGVWRQGRSGRPTKAYSVTQAGERFLARRLREWRSLVKAMDLALERT
jgi:PadR family transcriptional regulator